MIEFDNFFEVFACGCEGLSWIDGDDLVLLRRWMNCTCLVLLVIFHCYSDRRTVLVVRHAGSEFALLLR